MQTSGRHRSMGRGTARAVEIQVAIGSYRAMASGRTANRDRLTPYDKHARARDTQALILRIIVVAVLGVLFWQAIIAAGRP